VNSAKNLTKNLTKNLAKNLANSPVNRTRTIMPSDRFAFFDPDKSAAARLAAQETGSDKPLQAMSVSALLARVKGALSDAFAGGITVVGEISNFKFHSSGHMYFRLKDASAAVDVAMFKSRAARLKFTPSDGMEVVVDGRVDVYEVRGQLQLYAERMTPRGQGALELAFRQLCEKLREEGLFDADAKKPVPRFPRAIGIVTSPTGAAIRDIRRTLRRRWGGVTAYLVAAHVQGEAAAAEIAQAVALLDANAEKYQIDTIIVARGGGSLEDLWAFNEEVVARAIYRARTPVISGVGHEVDTTIADMVADARAATPTAAAEIAVPDAVEVRRYVDELGARMTRQMREFVSAGRAMLQGIARSVVFRDPLAGLRTRIRQVDELSLRCRAAAAGRLARSREALQSPSNRLAALHPARLATGARARLERLRHRLAWALGAISRHASDRLGEARRRMEASSPVHRLRLARQKIAASARQLDAMSYRAVLGRGFSVTRAADGRIIRSKTQTSEGQTITTELSDGKISSVIGQTGIPKKTRPPDAETQGGLFD